MPSLLFAGGEGCLSRPSYLILLPTQCPHLNDPRSALLAGTQVLERLDLDDSLIPNHHLAIPGSSELSYTSSLASAPERMMLLTTRGDIMLLCNASQPFPCSLGRLCISDSSVPSNLTGIAGHTCLDLALLLCSRFIEHRVGGLQVCAQPA